LYADLNKQHTMKHAYKHTFTLLLIAALALFSHGTLMPWHSHLYIVPAIEQHLLMPTQTTVVLSPVCIVPVIEQHLMISTQLLACLF
jgi:hypothetical protein